MQCERLKSTAEHIQNDKILQALFYIHLYHYDNVLLCVPTTKKCVPDDVYRPFLWVHTGTPKWDTHHYLYRLEDRACFYGKRFWLNLKAEYEHYHCI